MDMSFWLQGFLIGFSVSVPIGPMSILCIKNSLSNGRMSGMVCGFGIASADAVYGIIAGFGLTFISNILIYQQVWLRLIGGIFLIVWGTKIFLEKPSEEKVEANDGGHVRTFLSTFLFTLTNPITIISFAAIFAGLGIISAGRSYTSATLLVLGIFSGSLLWWLILSNGVYSLKKKLNLNLFRLEDKILGAIIIVFGVISLLNIKF